MALKAWYKLDGNAKNNNGDTTLDGVATGVTWTAGKIGDAALFSNGNILLNSSINLVSSTDWTVSAWIKTSSTAAQTILSNSSGGPVWNMLSIESSKIAYRHYNGAWYTKYGTSTITDGAWHHLVWRNSNNKIDLIVDGVIEANQVDSTSGTNPVNQIGKNWSSQYMVGHIDDVKIYNHALKIDQIERLAGKTVTGELVGHWPLVGDANDITDFGNNGVVNGATFSSGLFGDAATFTTAHQHIMTGASFTALTKFTYALWVKRTVSLDTYLLVGSRFGNNTYISASIIGNKIGLHKYAFNNNSDTTIAVGTTSLALNKWYHITITYDEGTTKTYLDGVLEGTGFHVNTGTDIRNFQINYDSSVTDSYRYFQGQIQDVRVYNYPLDENKINEISKPKILHYEFKSKRQEATANLIPNSPVNSYPGIGNSHGTYNTNNYNSNVDYSIGTMGSITDNIVTLATVGRVINDFDVLNAGSTGGGVTGGTEYLIKKHSANSFSLHAYSGVQDGSLGYINPETGKPKTHDSYYKDERLAINETDFPLLWHGNAHRPNSHLVKEIIPNAYNGETFNGHSFIRCHTEHIVGGGTDGMAYGVYAQVTSGETYSFSFFYRAAPGSALNATVRLGLHTTTGWTGDDITVTITDYNWHEYKFTAVAPGTGGTNMYWWFTKGSTVDISEIQCEHKPHSTPYDTGTRDGAIVEDSSISGNHGTVALTTTPKWVTGERVSYGAFEFDDAITKFTTPAIITEAINEFTLSFWIKPTATGYLMTPQSYGIDHKLIIDVGNQRFGVGITELADSNNRNRYSSSNSVLANQWTHIGLVMDNLTIKIYVNGELDSTHVETIPVAPYTGTWEWGQRGNETNYFGGKLANIEVYKKILSESEIQEIYNQKSKQIQIDSTISGSKIEFDSTKGQMKMGGA